MRKPWLKFYGDMPEDIEVPDATIYEWFTQRVARDPGAVAMHYMGRKFTYRDLLADVDQCAAALSANGIGPGDSVIVSLPNVPAAVICFYAINKIGATAAMTHPLSSRDELKHYIMVTESRFAVTVDMFYGVFHDLADETGLERLLLARVSDYLPLALKAGFALTKGRKIPPVPAGDALVVTWRDFMATGRGAADEPAYVRPIEPDTGCVVLFSGGTTDLPKGIVLTSANFNALSVMVEWLSGIKTGDSVLSIMPVFHGFGLGLTVHTALVLGAPIILVPEFSPEIYINNVMKYQPAFIAGVPTLFQAMMKHPKFGRIRFDNLKAVYSGGDMLSADLKRRFDRAIQAQGAKSELTEGYGMTESVTAFAASPPGKYKENSLGIPGPGMTVMVADPETGEELPYDTAGEICMFGPTVMQGYLKDPEATAYALRRHADGITWLHTGDIGRMDADGYLYFMGRLKRLVKVSGVSVYPMQVEQVLESHPLVNRACVIGIPDDYQVSSIKAFVMLNDGSLGSDEIRADIIAYCRQRLIKWAVPRHLEFRTSFPMTRVGKIAYTDLEREEAAKRGLASA